MRNMKQKLKHRGQNDKLESMSSKNSREGEQIEWRKRNIQIVNIQ